MVKKLLYILIGPDGKLYVAQSNMNYLGVINSPNLAGVACNYVSNGFYLGGQAVGMGLNNYIEYKTYCSPDGINEIKDELNVFFFPSPSSGSFTIQTNTSKVTRLEIFNVMGELVYTLPVSSSSSIKVDISGMPEGVYFVRIQTAEGMVSKKIVLIK